MDKAKKKQIKKYIAWIALAALVAGLAAMPLLAETEAAAEGPQASVLSGSVQMGSVGVSLHGGGNLAAADAMEVSLPGGIKITEFLVKNGDLVTEGTPLAAVDRVSLMDAIVRIQDTMDYLLEEMEDAADETADTTVSATSGGRVKQIFARKGDDVLEVMLQHGALAVLSLDGRMAVKLAGETALATGDGVEVTLSDGTGVPGRVESNLDGETVITVEDAGFAVGEEVAVSTEDGHRVGSGELYVHNAWKATAFTGTVSSVNVREERTVYDGATLFTLTDTEFAARQELLAAEYREYSALLARLFRIYQDEVITAPCDGMVSGVDEDSAFLLSGGEIRYDVVPLTADSSETAWTVQLLSHVEEEDPGQGEPPEEPEEPTDPSEEPEPAFRYSVTVGCVSAAAEGVLILNAYPEPIPVDDLSQIRIDTALMTAAIAREIAGTTVYQKDLTTPYPDPITAGDILFFVTDSEGSAYVVWAGKTETSQPHPGGMGGMGAMMGGMAGYGSAPQIPQVFEKYDLTESTLLTVTNQDTMTLAITLDERDIAAVCPGQVAQITVEALRGQTFEALVTEVASSGANNGGSSKFTVELTMEKTADMLAGMTATATIDLYTKMDVLTIPVAALWEEGTRTVVYTALDPETGLPCNPVEVTLGVSDGETAEILSGMTSGQNFYYTYYDTLELSTEVEDRKFSFGR